MAAYRRVDDLQSPAGWLPVHRDQLRAQHSVSSMRSLYLLFKGALRVSGFSLLLITLTDNNSESTQPSSHWELLTSSDWLWTVNCTRCPRLCRLQCSRLELSAISWLQAVSPTAAVFAEHLKANLFILPGLALSELLVFFCYTTTTNNFMAIIHFNLC